MTVKEDVERGTRNAKELRVKCVSKDGHYHREAMKLDMEEIMAKKPLIVRKGFQIPRYNHPHDLILKEKR